MNIYVMGTLFVQLALGLNSFISTQGFATQAMITVLVEELSTILTRLSVDCIIKGERPSAITGSMTEDFSRQ